VHGLVTPYDHRVPFGPLLVRVCPGPIAELLSTCTSRPDPLVLPAIADLPEDTTGDDDLATAVRIRHGVGVVPDVCAADESDPWQVEAWLLVGRHWRVGGHHRRGTARPRPPQLPIGHGPGSWSV